MITEFLPHGFLKVRGGWVKKRDYLHQSEACQSSMYKGSADKDSFEGAVAFKSVAFKRTPSEK